jgi:hypothetical protein
MTSRLKGNWELNVINEFPKNSPRKAYSAVKDSIDHLLNCLAERIDFDEALAKGEELNKSFLGNEDNNFGLSSLEIGIRICCRPVEGHDDLNALRVDLFYHPDMSLDKKYIFKELPTHNSRKKY